MDNATSDLPKMNQDLLDKLTPSMVHFLSKRHQYKDDAETLRELGYSANTAQVWRSRHPAFRRLHDELREHIALAIVTFDELEYIKKHLVPDSVKRLAEIVHPEITKKTTDARIRVIASVALKVLVGAGLMKPESETNITINSIVAESLSEGQKFKASWQTFETPKLSVLEKDSASDDPGGSEELVGDSVEVGDGDSD